MDCVYCAVRTEYLKIILANLSLQSPCFGSGSRRRLTAKVRVRYHTIPCEFSRGQSVTVTGFSPPYFGFPLSVSFHQCSVLVLSEAQAGKACKSPKPMLYRKVKRNKMSVSCRSWRYLSLTTAHVTATSPHFTHDVILTITRHPTFAIHPTSSVYEI
jgi:hypothetical protein